MAKTIEDEILDVYGVSPRKRGESAQTYYGRLVHASSLGTEKQQDDAWDKLGASAQEWINEGVLAKKAGREYVGFPDAPEPVEEAAPAPEPVEEEEQRPPRRARAAAAPQPEPAPARRARAPRAKKAEPVAQAEAPPARRRVVDDAPPARRRVVDDTPPARRRVVDDEAPPARRRVIDDGAPPAPARRRATAGKRGNGGTGVYALTQEYVVKHPNATTADIMAALEKKGLTPQQHTVQSVRGHTRDTLKLVQRIRGFDVGIAL